jgi:hypothetical protein
MEIVVIIIIIVAIIAFGMIRRLRQPLSPADIENVKQRVQTLQERANTQFLATPGDPRLQAGREYMVALKKPGEDIFTFTYFTSVGISRTQDGMSEEAVFALKDQGWHINAQRLTGEGMAWQLERPTNHTVKNTIPQ